MFNIDNTTHHSSLPVVAQEQLFTELTPEEGAIIKGGATLKLTRIYAHKAGADGDGSDELYINMKTIDFNTRIWGTQQMFSERGIDFVDETPFRGDAIVTLYDNDKWPNPDDRIGSFDVSAYRPGPAMANVVGGGSNYDVYYEVIA